ncbi:MAG: hypothetical protein KF773_11520 [Deltaproteobacteria bacterium]|nr:hypothetical protein [Deltaproteobacteria bacterium]MCW5809033.1 hypothetical protein [Deltaproteobacteria bacterium]
MRWFLFQLFLFAGLLAWIARTAQERGRNVVGWSIGAVVGGGLGLATGIRWLSDVASSDQDVSSLTLFGVFLAPSALMAAVMGAIGIVLRRGPVVVSTRAEWPIHVVNRGDGTLRIHAGLVEVRWPHGSLSRAAELIDRVEPDGECVRITVAGEELAILPMSKPDTREGRIAQALAITKQLRPTRGRR